MLEHCAVLVEELESRRETTVCLHWRRWVVGREREVGEKKYGGEKWAGLPRAHVGTEGRVAEQLLGRKSARERGINITVVGFELV